MSYRRRNTHVWKGKGADRRRYAYTEDFYVRPEAPKGLSNQQKGLRYINQANLYGTADGKKSARANVSARARNALAMLERCARERLEHRAAARARRQATTAGANTRAIARWAAANKNRFQGKRKMAQAIQFAWAFVKQNGYQKNQDLTPIIARA